MAIWLPIHTRCNSGADPGSFLGGGALVSCSTSTPINHIVFFRQNTSCIRKSQVISMGGAHPLQFMCNEGLILRGSKIRQCLSTGNWSGNESFCEGTTKHVENVIDEWWLILSNAHEKCFEKVLVIVGFIFTIVAVNCGGLSSPMNGSISGNLTVYPNIVTFSCDPGFILHGSSVRKCQSNGTWDGYKTACEGIMHKIPNGHVQVLLNVLRPRLQKRFSLSQHWEEKTFLRWPNAKIALHE